MARKRKLNWRALPDFYSADRVKKVNPNGDVVVRGTLFKLCDYLTTDDCDFIMSYQNTELVNIHEELDTAELTAQAVIIWDKCIRKAEEEI